VQFTAAHLNPQLANKTLPAAQRRVTRKDTSNEERSFNPFLGKAEIERQNNFENV
jgi:hypothetical protein